MGKKQRSKEELASVKALVKGAIGFQADRGDTVVVEARDFQTVEAVEENWWEAGWVSLLVRNLSALLVALALIFGIGKPLLKKIKSGKSGLNSADRLQIASDIGNELNRSGGASQQPANPVSLEMINSAAGYSERAFLIQDFVRQNPDHAALVVQDLLAEGQGEEETADE
jgi:flagellar M-ring protein FliF